MGQRVEKILREKFTGIQIDFEELSGQRLTGSLIWAGFGGYDHVDRQQMVRQALQDALGPDIQQVGVLLTYTPTEFDAMTAA